MSSPVTLIDSKIEEAHHLLSATHDYIKWQAPKDMNAMDPHMTFLLSSEAMRIRGCLQIKIYGNLFSIQFAE